VRELGTSSARREFSDAQLLAGAGGAKWEQAHGHAEVRQAVPLNQGPRPRAPWAEVPEANSQVHFASVDTSKPAIGRHLKTGHRSGRSRPDVL